MLRNPHSGRSLSSDTTSGLPSELLSSGVNVGASTSRSSSSGLGVGSSSWCEARLAQVVQRVPEEAMSGAQWASRSDSSSHDKSGSLRAHWRSTFSESSTSASTPQLPEGHPSHLTTSSSTLLGASCLAPSARTSLTSTPHTPAPRRGAMVSGDHCPQRTPARFLTDTTQLPSTAVSGGQRSSDLSSVKRKRTTSSTSSHGDPCTTSTTLCRPQDSSLSTPDGTQDDLGSRGHSEDDISQVRNNKGWRPPAHFGAVVVRSVLMPGVWLQVVMSVSWSQGKLGAAFYDVTSAQVYVVEDKAEAAPDFWVLTTLFREQRPRWVLVGGRQDDRLFTVLRQLCGIPPTPLCTESTPTHAQEGDGSGRGGSSSSSRVGSGGAAPPPASPTASSTTGSCTIRVLPMADFKYQLCVRRVLSLVLPGEPDGLTEAQRELFVRGKVNTDLVSMTRALGALLRFLDKHGVEVLASAVLMDVPPILGLHLYVMEDLAQLDDATATALQLFSEDQHPASFKSGKSSASKEGLSVYALLSRTSCPMAAHTLRRVLLRPVVEREVLEARYAAVGWGVDPANLDTLRQLQACLKHITNVPVTASPGSLYHHLPRCLFPHTNTCRRNYVAVDATGSRRSERQWSLFNSILVGEQCQAQDQDIPIFKLTGESVTEGLYRATFLIQRIMDIEQSEREARFVVKPGVDTDLDHKKRRFSGLGEVMRRVAEVELAHLPQEVESCCIIYLPHVGYLLAFPPSPDLDRTLSAQDYSLPGLEFMFKTADMVLYKSQTCLELDRELGDMQVEIANHETRIMMRLVETLLQQAHNFLALLHHILMLDCSQSSKPTSILARAKIEVGFILGSQSGDPGFDSRLLAFSVVSREGGWVRPELTQEPVLEIEEARHPLYELCTPTFVANPVRSGRPHQCITLVTGPNASGKTVYLKQVGVVAVLAQVGCWVPAGRARLRPLDAIIAVTQTTPPVTSALSTFMLDLTRMCAALARATQYSLVIIDEFGAATYENDGAALLTACLDYWSERATRERTPARPRSGKRGRGKEDSTGEDRDDSGTNWTGAAREEGGGAAVSAPPHVFVSTHLLQVYDHLLNPDAVRCLALEAVEEGGTVVPLYQVTEGRAHTSYAAAVAALSGVPDHLIHRANQVFECIRGGRLPPRWTLLEDENERMRCEAIVSLLLSHDLSRDPLHLLLEKIRGYSHTPESPSRSGHLTPNDTNNSAGFRALSNTPRRSSPSRRGKSDGDVGGARSSRVSERMLARDVNPSLSCVETVLLSGASTPVSATQDSPQVSHHASPNVIPQSMPQTTPQIRAQVNPHTGTQVNPHITVSRVARVTTPDTRDQTIYYSSAEATIDTRAQDTQLTRVQPLQETRSELIQQAQATPDIRAQATPDIRAQATPDIRAQATPDIRAQATPDIRAQATPDIRAQATPDIRAQATPDITHQTTPDIGVQTIQRTSDKATTEITHQATSDTRDQISPGSVAQVTQQTRTQATSGNKAQTTEQYVFATPQLLTQFKLSKLSQPVDEVTRHARLSEEEPQHYKESGRSVVIQQGAEMNIGIGESRTLSVSPGHTRASTEPKSSFNTPSSGCPQGSSHKYTPQLQAQAITSQTPKIGPNTRDGESNNSNLNPSLSKSESRIGSELGICTPIAELCTLKIEHFTPLIEISTPSTAVEPKKIESETPATVPRDSTTEPSIMKIEPITPMTVNRIPRIPGNPASPSTPQILYTTGGPYTIKTPGTPSNIPRLSDWRRTCSQGETKRYITPESTLASISQGTGDSFLPDFQEQESSNVSSCSQDSLPLTRQYSLKPSNLAQLSQGSAHVFIYDPQPSPSE
nr:uncharacterized protein LOC123765720 [Procambarus clarkii]